jgi:acyl carrier protein
MDTILECLKAIGGVFVFLLIVGFPVWIYQEKQKSRKFRNVFSGRPPLSEQDYYERYFRDRNIPSDVVIKIRKILEEVLETDLARLQPTDDFNKNLSFFFEYDSMAAEELMARLEEEFNVNITFAEAEKAHTIEEIVKLVWLKLG